MTRRLLIAVMGCALLVSLAATGGASTVVTLELEAAYDDTDSQQSEFEFQVEGEGDVDIDILTPEVETRSGGDITHEFVRWEKVGDTSVSGEDMSWTAEGGESYRVIYESTAEGDATEGNYAFDFEAEGDGEQYQTTSDVDVVVLEPEFGTIESESTEIVFEPGSDDPVTESVGLTVPNDGDGELVPSDVTVENVPGGFVTSVESVPDEIEASDSGTTSLEITADESVDSGTYDLTVVVEDNLGNQAQTTVEMEVFHPPGVQAEPEELDIGDVLIGEPESAEFDLVEYSENRAVDELDVWFSSNRDATLDADDFDGMSLSAGGEETVEVTVDVDDDAPQHEELEWVVDFAPEAENAPQNSLTVTADVIYPPYFGRFTASNTVVEFDTPRDATATITDTVRVDVPNDGDLEMDIVDSGASIEGASLQAEVVSAPDTIDGRSSEELLIDVTADAEPMSGDRELTVTIESEEDGVEELSTDVDLDQFPAPATSQQQVDFGEVPIATEEQVTVELEEELGYRDVEDFQIAVVDQPGGEWLRATTPEQLAAGAEERLELALEFDADAELFTTYEWRYRVDGSNIEPLEIDIVAVPRPVECTELVNDLEGYEGPSADTAQFSTEIASMIRIVEESARADQVALEEVAHACTAGRGAMLFLNANENIVDADDPEVHQENVARMAFAFSTVERFGAEFNDETAEQHADAAISISHEILDERIAERESVVLDELDNATLLEEAQGRTELARLAGLQGQEEEAETAREAANEAFETYISTVDEGNEALRTARETDEELRESVFLFNEPLFWIGDYDEFQTNRESTLQSYDDAIESHEQAGAEERAQLTSTEREQVASTYQRALIFTGIGTGLLGLAFLAVLLYEAKRVYSYIQDVQAAQTGMSLI